MKIGIDISQIIFEGTGVAIYTQKLVENLLKIDRKNEYVLFFSSMRKKFPISNFLAGGQFSINFKFSNYQIKKYRIPPMLLEFLWNRLHIFPIEWLIGRVDVYLSSDWLQPPTKAKKVTTLHDLIVYKYPESFAKKGGHNIVINQKKRLKWVKKECDLIICDSQATKKDAIEILKINEKKLKVIYPGGIC